MYPYGCAVTEMKVFYCILKELGILGSNLHLCRCSTKKKALWKLYLGMHFYLFVRSLPFNLRPPHACVDAYAYVSEGNTLALKQSWPGSIYSSL